MAKRTQKGKKGGLSVFSVESIGAMTGAAIGGLTGLVLGSKNARKKIENFLGNIEIKTKETEKEKE